MQLDAPAIRKGQQTDAIRIPRNATSVFLLSSGSKSPRMCFFHLFCRSPSPEPIYSSDGKRLNTREFRTRKRLEEQRHQLILRMQCMNPEFKPPSDYK